MSLPGVYRYTALVMSLFVLAECSTVGRAAAEAPISSPKSCFQDEPRREARSRELQQIVKADQDDRKDFLHLTPVQLAQMAVRDVKRRERVGEIFGEGCFSRAEDYSAAALVFQHGDTPDQFYQVFIWAKRAVELGDAKQKDLMALGLDRYLVNSGKKQLFASQAHATDVEGCYCLQQVEHSFPDSERREYTGKTLGDQLKWVDELNQGRNCAPASECAEHLSPTPKGSIPGFW